MITRTRAKYYVSNANNSSHYPSVENPPVSVEVTFAPVYSPNPNTENYNYWSSSPSGKMVLVFDEAEGAAFRPGTFWYIDVEPIEDQEAPIDKDTFKLTKLEDHGGAMTIRLNRATAQGGGFDARSFFEVYVQNSHVWPLFLNKIGSRYRLWLTKATKDG